MLQIVKQIWTNLVHQKTGFTPSLQQRLNSKILDEASANLIVVEELIHFFLIAEFSWNVVVVKHFVQESKNFVRSLVRPFREINNSFC